MDINEKIKIMLKGVADHTEDSEIIKKFKQAEKENRPLRIKLGLDPSAPDIHLGHAVVLRKIKQLQDLGAEAIVIIGDFTGMIGDPTGKSKTRKQLTKQQVEENAKTYKEQILKILDKDKTIVKFNSEWLGKMNFRDVIELSSKCTVARMLERDDFKKRYETNMPISVHEFFYPLMQAYDSVAVKSDIELGGTDQTFNILMGRNIQKDFGEEPQLTLFMPLLEGLDGTQKMSKSLGNYIGINEDANTMYEKCMKIPDELILKYYNLCTDEHPDEIEKIEQKLKNGENPRNIKMQLAKTITNLYHTKEETENAQKHFKSVFQKGQAPEDIEELKVEKSENMSINLLDAILSTKKYASKGEIRRLFMQGAVKLNNEKITDINSIKEIKDEDILQIGKGVFLKIRI